MESPSPAAPPPAAPGGFGARLGRLGSESLVYGLSAILGRFLGYLLQPFYASQFTAADNGVQTVVYTLLSLTSVVFVLGLDVAYMRSAAAHADDGGGEDPEVARSRAFTLSLAAIAGIGAALLGLGLLAVPWAAGYFGVPPYALRYLLAIVYTDALLSVSWAHLRITGRARRFAGLRLGFVGLSVALNLVLILGLRWGVEAVFLANLAANLVLVALLAPEAARLFRPALLRGHPGWRATWAYALPLVPASFAVLLVENADKLVLARIPADVARRVYGMTPGEVVGSYGFNYKLGIAMLLVVQMFRMAWTPFSLAHAREPRAPQLFSRVLTGLVLACAGVFLAVALFLPPLVRVPAVYGIVREPEYWAALPIVPVILLGYVFSGIYAVVTAGLYIERRTGALPWIAGVGAAVNLALCMVGLRRGMVAVAWATPAAYALMAGLGAWRSQRVYPVPYEWGRLLHVAAVAGAVFWADRWLDGRGLEGHGAAVWGAKALLLLAFPLLLVATRFFRAGEWRAMRAALGKLAPA
ncbi:MAG TPA: lipopolysaccharide biosynthesis protein [Longimicrobiaceae bacterium]|jgi:O-antigen/teichoic acid export membrane protein